MRTSRWLATTTGLKVPLVSSSNKQARPMCHSYLCLYLSFGHFCHCLLRYWTPCSPWRSHLLPSLSGCGTACHSRWAVTAAVVLWKVALNSGSVELLGWFVSPVVARLALGSAVVADQKRQKQNLNILQHEFMHRT